MTEAVATTGERPPGSWRQVGFALAGYLLLPVVPIFRSIIPIEQTLLLLVPVIAVCTILGWRLGGRPVLAIVWSLLAGWILMQHAGAAGTPYDGLARGWALLLAGSFGLLSLWSSALPFFVRALASVALAAGAAFVLVAASPGGVGRVQRAAGSEFTRRSTQSIAALRQVAETRRWREWAAKSPGIDEIAEQSESQLRAVPSHSASMLPALLGLESLVALALGWGVYHRLSTQQIGPTLGPLRDFRFNDQLVWGVAVGATLFLLPPFADGKNTGLNLLLFFGGLYLVRGIGIMAWMSRGRVVFIAVVALALLAWPLLGALALALGLGDTWLDWRRRARAS